MLILLQRVEGKNIGVGMKGNFDVTMMGKRVAETLVFAKAWENFLRLCSQEVADFFLL